MILAMCSAELPNPSGPSLRSAGHASFLSVIITGAPLLCSSRWMHCSTMRSDSRISLTRIRYRP